MEELLGNDMVYQHRLEQANERVNHYLAEELEIADKKRKLNPSKTAIDESTPDTNNTDQERKLVLHRCSATNDGDSSGPGCRRN